MERKKRNAIRVARIKSHADVDLSALSHLLASVGMRRRVAVRMQTAINASTDVFAAHANGELVGFGRLVSDLVYYGTIWDLAVRPDMQNNGIGSDILLGLLGRARHHRLVMVGLFTAHHNRTFYERHGFRFHSNIFAMTRLTKPALHV